jgi:hypothetical protein
MVQLFLKVYWRTVVNCGDYDAADEHNVRAIADAVWTADLIAEYEASIAQPETV